ncbi:MAG: MAPEG family protein [Pseudomonadota bacterium]
MFAMFILTFTVLFRLFRLRSKLVAEGRIDPAYFSVYQGAQEPMASAQLSRHFTNLHEAPVLFYVCCLAAIATKATGLAFLLLAWGYVVVRAMHTLIHTGKNELWPRIYAYFGSWIVLLAMWLLLVVRVASIS